MAELVIRTKSEVCNGQQHRLTLLIINLQPKGFFFNLKQTKMTGKVDALREYTCTNGLCSDQM